MERSDREVRLHHGAAGHRHDRPHDPGAALFCGGARKPEQVLDNAGALHIKLDGADAVRMKWDVDAIS